MEKRKAGCVALIVLLVVFVASAYAETYTGAKVFNKGYSYTTGAGSTIMTCVGANDALTTGVGSFAPTNKYVIESMIYVQSELDQEFSIKTTYGSVGPGQAVTAFSGHAVVDGDCMVHSVKRYNTSSADLSYSKKPVIDKLELTVITQSK